MIEHEEGMSYVQEIERKLAILVEAMRVISDLKTKTLLGDSEMTYSDGANNAFCEAASFADSALRGIR